MKRFFIIMLAALFLVGCQQATNTEKENAVTNESTAIQTTDGVRYVKNSCWGACSLSYLTAKTSSRAVVAEISADDLENIIDTLNEKTNDDQLVVLTEDVPIEESPLVDVYIVNEGDYAPLAEYIGLDRIDFVARRADFDLDARCLGGILFVDKIPPVPIPAVDTRTRHEKYHIQMVNKYDKIVVYNGFRYEESCEETWDAMHGIDPSFDYESLDVYFASRISGYETEIRGVGLVPEDSPWRVVSGSIYTESTE